MFLLLGLAMLWHYTVPLRLSQFRRNWFRWPQRMQAMQRSDLAVDIFVNQNRDFRFSTMVQNAPRSSQGHTM